MICSALLEIVRGFAVRGFRDILTKSLSGVPLPVLAELKEGKLLLR